MHALMPVFLKLTSELQVRADHHQHEPEKETLEGGARRTQAGWVSSYARGARTQACWVRICLA